jgi:hypothetical protein
MRSLGILAALFVVASSGCASMGRPELAYRRGVVSLAYEPPNTAPLSYLHANGAGVRCDHMVGGVTVYGVTPQPINFELRESSLAKIVDALGGLPKYSAMLTKAPPHRLITECPTDVSGVAFSLHDMRRREALVIVARFAGKRIVVAANVEGNVDLEVRDAEPDALLRMLAADGGLIIVAQAEAGPLI